MARQTLTPGNLRKAVLAAHAVLMAGLVLTGGWPGAVLALPLLAPLDGLWRGRSYTFAWCSLLIVFYAGGLLAEGYAAPAHRAAMFLVALVAAIEFVALVLYVRINARYAATAARTEGSGGA
jgi:uncharacterized membrane protein